MSNSTFTWTWSADQGFAEVNDPDAASIERYQMSELSATVYLARIRADNREDETEK